MSQGMRLFITGGSGFIGRCLLPRLVEKGHRCCCLARPSSRIAGLEMEGIEWVRGDIGAPEVWREAVVGCDAVVHLANLYSFWERDKQALWRANVEGTRHVLQAALDAGTTKVLHVSSVVVFGRQVQVPFTESSLKGEGLCSEYARTKYEGDRIAWEMRDQQGLPLVVLYPAGVLGPGDPQASGRYIADLLERRLPARLLEDALTTWVYVEDVAEAIVLALEAPDNIGEEYIVGKHRSTMGEFNRMVGEIGAVSLPRFYMPWPLARLSGAVLTAWADIRGRPPLWGMARESLRTVRQGVEADGSKVEHDLGLQYTGLRQMLEKTVAAYRGKLR
jgi:dihydroflavonol-4-reductase